MSNGRVPSPQRGRYNADNEAQYRAQTDRQMRAFQSVTTLEVSNEMRTQARSLLGLFGATPAAQPAAIANATSEADAVTKLNALLAALRGLGVIAT